jgi:long-chain fatty acid transport protein
MQWEEFMGYTKTSLRSFVTLLACISICAAPHAYGSGFGIFTQGASALGQADAVIAHPDGPSAVFFNPAMMTKLAGTQVEIGTTLVFPSRDYTAPDGSTAATRDTVFTPSTFYLTHAFSDKASAGLGVFNPFGLGTDWGGDWGGSTPQGGLGRYVATNSELTTWNINPAFSYRVIPSLSVAAGLDIVLLDATLESAYFTGGPDGRQKFTGDGNGLGYNVGIYYELTDAISLGASYRSQVDIDVDGTYVTNLPPQNIGGSTTIKLPQQVFAGVACHPLDRLTLEGSMRWEDWSSFRQLRIQFAQPAFGVLQSVTYPRDWHSTFAFSLGGKYRLNDSYAIMAGYLHGWNPVPDSTFEPAIPDSETNLFTVGGEGRFGRVTVALGYGYQHQSARAKVDNAFASSSDPTLPTFPGNANGTYESDLHLVGLSVGYTF